MGISSALGVVPAFALAATLTAASAVRADGPPDPNSLVKAELVAETTSLAPAATLWVDLHLAIKPGWHVYWRNPGDSGLPTTIDWELPSGFSAGAISWPVPEHFVQGGIGNYGYAGSADLLVPISVAKEVTAGGTAVLSAEASWLACAEICIPGGANLSLNLPVVAGPAASDAAAAALFAEARRQLPLPAAFETRFVSGADDYRLLVPQAALAGLQGPTGKVFPNDGSLIDHAAEPRASYNTDGLEIALKKANATGRHARDPRRRAGAARRGRRRTRFRDQRQPGRGAAGRDRPRLVAGAAACLAWRHRPQRHALRLPDPVFEAA